MFIFIYILISICDVYAKSLYTLKHNNIYELVQITISSETCILL